MKCIYILPSQSSLQLTCSCLFLLLSISERTVRVKALVTRVFIKTLIELWQLPEGIRLLVVPGECTKVCYTLLIELSMNNDFAEHFSCE